MHYPEFGRYKVRKGDLLILPNDTPAIISKSFIGNDTGYTFEVTLLTTFEVVTYGHKENYQTNEHCFVIDEEYFRSMDQVTKIPIILANVGDFARNLRYFLYKTYPYDKVRQKAHLDKISQFISRIQRQVLMGSV